MQADLPQPVVAETDNTLPTAPAEAAALEAVAFEQPPLPEAPAGPGAPAPAAASLSPAACGAKLIELFPALFAQGAPYGPMKPLKLRIQADLQQRAPGVFSRRTLGIFFSRYTTSNVYLKALTLAPHRFDLDGQPAGEISDEHRGMAAEELARRHALAAERRAAQRPAPTPRPEAPNAAAQAEQAALATHQAGAISDAAPPVPSEPRHPPQAPHRPQPQPGQVREPRPPPRQDRGPPRADRPDPSARPGQPQRPQRPQRNDRQDRGQRGDRYERPDRVERMPPPAVAPPPVPLPVDPALRERALLLRSYDASPLSKANFCTLKGISEGDLDAAVAQAQAERSRR